MDIDIDLSLVVGLRSFCAIGNDDERILTFEDLDGRVVRIRLTRLTLRQLRELIGELEEVVDHVELNNVDSRRA